ncbi:hypothetical protein GCM10010149_62280 [Nonomuraea roseoviolacea subsp. roseoviolacea]
MTRSPSRAAALPTASEPNSSARAVTVTPVMTRIRRGTLRRGGAGGRTAGSAPAGAGGADGGVDAGVDGGGAWTVVTAFPP